MRTLIVGGPNTGKTTLANAMCEETPLLCLHTDDLIHMGWSEASHHVADVWLPRPGPHVIEGVAVARGLRKWAGQHGHAKAPVDKLIWLTEPHVDLNPGQYRMLEAHDTVLSSLLEEWPALRDTLVMR